MDGHSNGFSFTNTSLATATVACPTCQEQKPPLSPQFGNHSATWWPVVYIGRNRVLFSLEYSETVTQIFPFLPTMLLPKPPSMNIKDALPICHGIPHNITSGQRISFIANEDQQWAQAHGIHQSCHVPHQSKVTWSESTVKQFFEDSVMVPAGWQHLEGLGNALQDAGYALNEQLTYGVLSPKARIHGSGS